MQWMVNILKERPESPSMFERWIQDGKSSSNISFCPFKELIMI